MTSEAAFYWPTHAGLGAWRCADSGLPEHYRRVLGAFVQTARAAAAYYRKAA